MVLSVLCSFRIFQTNNNVDGGAGGGDGDGGGKLFEEPNQPNVSMAIFDLDIEHHAIHVCLCVCVFCMEESMY